MALWDIPAQVDSWVEVSERGTALVLRIGGELDGATRARVEPAIVAAVTTASSVVIDLSELTFCDSSGIAMFIAAHEQANTSGTRLAIRHPRPPVQRVIELTGLDALIPFESQPGTVWRKPGSAGKPGAGHHRWDGLGEREIADQQRATELDVEDE